MLAALGCSAGLLAVPAHAATTTVGPRGVIHVDGAPTFPIALLKPPPLDVRTPWGTDGVDEVVRAGVNLLGAGPLGFAWNDGFIEESRAWNRVAAARGVHTWVHLRELARAAPGSPEEAMLRRVIAELQGDPALAMWKSVDEPWHSGFPVDVMRHSYGLMRSLDPAHLSLTIQAARGTPTDLGAYSSVTDLHSVDVYPVRHYRRNPNLHYVGIWTNRIRSATPNRAVLTTLGACFSGSRDPLTGVVVLPTLEQQRYMAYDAILNGARGLIYFGNHNTQCLSPEEAPLGWNWTYWRDVLAPIVRELGPRSRLYPALLAPATGIGVRSSDPRTQVVSRVAGRDLWVIAARRGVGTKPVTLRGLPRTLRRGWVYREGRTIPVRKGALTDRFARWDVHVYRFLLPPGPSS